MMCSDVLIFRSSKSSVDPRSLASIVIHSTSLSAIPTPPLINASTPHQIHPASLGFVPRQQNDVISLGQHAKDRAARKRIPKFLVVQVPSPGSAVTSGTWLSIDSDGAWITPLLISTSGASFPFMIGPTFFLHDVLAHQLVRDSVKYIPNIEVGDVFGPLVRLLYR